MSNAAKYHEAQSAKAGTEEGVSEWFEVTQNRINAFADATLDHQFIHIDPEAAATTPFGGTIAHGLLTLSLLVHLDATIERNDTVPAGILMGINYGFDKVRFLTPVPSGGRIRLRSVIGQSVLKGNNVDTTRSMTVELEGSDKPAMVADWITRAVFDS
ncbi:MAG: MaoC family dehydratase [Acidimicrobiia bacterium]|nr:MaoC family dehydratase [Acidimicrobiia bacterium]MDH5238039.1 MaoC family dehydratase [Acidimicrobiia bacterium]